MPFAGLAHFSFRETLSVTLTLFAVIDILGSIPVLLSLKSKMGKIHAGLATGVSGFLILLFFFAGAPLLDVLGLDVGSFAIAGAIVIFIIGLEMVLGHEIFRSENSGSSGNIVPIAFPLIAGSGTLTTVMSLKAAFHAGNILLGILINLIIVFVCLRSINFIERLLGDSGIAVVRKFFGVILLAIAIKIFRNNVGF
ncbi:MAG: MarC family protein [Bacteroidetes bacterium]|nr:MarC family protein [Bacteroidota bacterium]MBS1630212.1 MarC family protein [Bacteroidota bacterium]